MDEIVRKKSKESYQQYKLPEVTYKGKGYFPVNDSLCEDNLFFYNHTKPININEISQDWQESLKDIMKYCNKQNIELVLISAPMPIGTVADMGNYDDYVEYVTEMAENYGINYYDFNLCKEDFFPTQISFFYDDDHLNQDGAELFTSLVCELLEGKKSKENLIKIFKGFCQVQLMHLRIMNILEM